MLFNQAAFGEIFVVSFFVFCLLFFAINIVIQISPKA